MVSAQGNATKEAAHDDLSVLSHTELIERVKYLEKELSIQTAKLTQVTAKSSSPAPSTPKTKKQTKAFDSGRYSTRFIALKFSYLGLRYNGFEHAHGCYTPLPTIEEVLWKALRKARLIDPPVAEGADDTFEVIFDEAKRARYYTIPGKSRPGDDSKKILDLSWDGCQYSKCGRTDKGVSAFGQVIGIRVRSNAPVQQEANATYDEAGQLTQETEDAQNEFDMDLDSSSDLEIGNEHAPFDASRDELPYMQILNRVLPTDIRVLACCLDPPPDFDARFSCQERRYKYLFTNPAFLPTPGPVGMKTPKGTMMNVREGWLDISKMREAAKKLEGLHDFRNLCAIDASKQMSSCVRRITFADVGELNMQPSRLVTDPDLSSRVDTAMLEANRSSVSKEQGPQVFAFTVHGTAFLWHQVRCMVAILFLVGQGLESPGVMDDLFDIEQIPGRPHYGMADDAPLILWDCVFPDAAVDPQNGLRWIYAGDAETIPTLTSKSDGKFGSSGTVDDLWAQWQEAKIKEAQIGALLSLAIDQGDDSSIQRGGFRDPEAVISRTQKLYEGASKSRLAGDYVPLVQRPLMPTLEQQNAKYLAGKGAKRAARKQEEAVGE